MIEKCQTAVSTSSAGNNIWIEDIRKDLGVYGIVTKVEKYQKLWQEWNVMEWNTNGS